MRQVFKYAICFLMSFFLLSCHNEELAEKNDNVNLSQIEKELSLTKFSNVNIAGNVEVNWQSVNEIRNNNFIIFEVAASEKNASTIQSDYFKDHLKYQVVTVKSENQTQSYFLEVFTNENSAVYPETITKLNDFSGTLNVFSLKGENLGSIAIIRGVARNISDNDSLGVLSNVINSFSGSRTTSKIPLCTENYAQITEQVTDRYHVVTVRGNVEAVYYMGSTTTYTSTILAYPCTGSGDRDVIILQRIAQYTHGGSGSEGVTALTVAEKTEEQIISDKLDPCPKAVLEQLKNATNCDVANILTKFGANKIYNVTLKTEEPTNGAPAQTIRTNSQIKNDYTIRISPNYTSATSLFRAATILHELTHAYFMSLIDDYGSSGNSVVFSDTPTLFQAFCDSKYPPKVNELPNLHHKEMADTYVNAIGAALQEFQTGIALANGETPNQIYSDLAWGGLRGTAIYNETFSKGSEDYKRIEARYAAESNNGTSGNQKAIGKPCKN